MSRAFVFILSTVGCAVLLSGCVNNEPSGSSTEAAREMPVVATPAFDAHGNEPFWSLESSGDGRIIYSTPEMPDGKTLFVEDSSAYAKGVNIFGKDESGNSFTIDINGKACQDSMSGQTYEMTVELNYNGSTNSGCGEMQ